MHRYASRGNERAGPAARWRARDDQGGGREAGAEKARTIVVGLDAASRLAMALIAQPGADIAREAFERYGRGRRHPARLHMGDRVACAKTNGARLLYKGDDFSHTGIA